jgi:hypothetical protein
MRLVSPFALAWILALLGGCASAPLQPVPMASTALSPAAGRIGVAMAALPKVDTEFPGAGCLLCLAVASATNSALTSHVRTLPYEDFPDLKKQVVAALGKKGVDAVIVDGDFKLDELQKVSGDGIGQAPRDFRPLRDKYKVDRMIVIAVNLLGVWRNYSAYVPTGDPRATVRGTAMMVNLQSNALEWYVPIEVSRGAATWDQPPKYPELTNAYFQVLELGKDAILKPLQ